MRLPKHTVTATRGSGRSGNVGAVLSMVKGGSINDLNSLAFTGDAYTYAIACRRNPDSRACRHLACEIAPNSKECEDRLDTIVVTANRPKKSNLAGVLSMHVDFSFSWTVNFGKSRSQIDKERRQKQLERKCRSGLNKLFADKNDLDLSSIFPRTPKGLFRGRHRNKIINTLIKDTKPIMTSGVDGKPPVDYMNGMEAGAMFYAHKQTGKFSRGNVDYGTEERIVNIDHTDDAQFNELLPNAERAQNVVIGFHTHPTKVPSYPNHIAYYAWPSPLDLTNHLIQKITGTIHPNALFAIGFYANNEYYISITQFSEKLTPSQILRRINGIRRLPDILNHLFKLETKMVILNSKGKVVDYFSFFRRNESQAKFHFSDVLPASCLSYLNGDFNE